MVRHPAHEVNQKYDFFRPHLAASLKAMIALHPQQADSFLVPSRTLGNHKKRSGSSKRKRAKWLSKPSCSGVAVSNKTDGIAFANCSTNK